MTEAIRDFITHPVVMGAWLVLMVASLIVLVRDLRANNPFIGGLMKAVWVLTVTYSGPVGLALYWTTGRAQIPDDATWRRGGRSVAHCYSGCGAGEIVGVIVAVGLLALGNLAVAAVTFTLAYTFGVALTVGPLRQEGLPWATAVKDGVISESASIIVMEAVAIGVDIWLAGDAGMGDALFWSGLVVSLSAGLAAAYPVNVLLVVGGVKAGMHDPREMASDVA